MSFFLQGGVYWEDTETVTSDRSDANSVACTTESCSEYRENMQRIIYKQSSAPEMGVMDSDPPAYTLSEAVAGGAANEACCVAGEEVVEHQQEPVPQR